MLILGCVCNIQPMKILALFAGVHGAAGLAKVRPDSQSAPQILVRQALSIKLETQKFWSRLLQPLVATSKWVVVERNGK